jgi:hypothetical protein
VLDGGTLFLVEAESFLRFGRGAHLLDSEQLSYQNLPEANIRRNRGTWRPEEVEEAKGGRGERLAVKAPREERCRARLFVAAESRDPLNTLSYKAISPNSTGTPSYNDSLGGAEVPVELRLRRRFRLRFP